jgi:hypothetical protein
MTVDLVKALSFEQNGEPDVNVGVCFVDGDYTKPDSVYVSCKHYDQRVSIPWDLWQRVIDAVNIAKVQ